MQLLRDAARRGETRTLRRLLDSGAVLPHTLYTSDENGDTPLHNAVRSGNAEVVRMLLDRGAPLEARNRWHLTPLHCAVEYAQPYCVRLLLERGAVVDARRWDGSTGLMAALAQAVSAATALACECALEMGRLLVGYGANPNARDDRMGRAPLMIGASHTDALELALAAGADIDARDFSGRTALMHAVLRCDLALTRNLLAVGADVNASDNDGFTPLMLLMYARLQSHTLLRELLRAGADVHQRSRSGETVFTLATNRGKSWWAVEELKRYKDHPEGGARSSA